MIELYSHPENHISQTISEDVNQELAALKVQIAQLLQKGGGNEYADCAAMLHAMDDRLSKIIRQLRDISEELSALEPER